MLRKEFTLTLLTYLLSIISSLIIFSISLSAQDNIWTVYNFGNALPSDLATGITVSTNGKVYISTFPYNESGGLAVYDGIKWENINKKTENFKENAVPFITTDKLGNIYVSFTSNGSAKFDGLLWVTIDSIGLDSSTNLLMPIVFDNNNKMWAGMFKKGMPPKSNFIGYYDSLWHVIRFDTTNKANYINGMAFDANNNLWIGTNNGLFKNSNEGVLEKIDSSKGFYERYISSFAPDDKGNIWIGTSNGVYYYDGTTWTKYDTSNSELQENRIYSLLLDKKNNLWIGTEYSGLIKFDGKTFTKFYKQVWAYYDGHYIDNLALDSTGNIWMTVSSNYGVFVLHPDLVRVSDDGINDDFQIYPNPFSSLFNIEFENKIASVVNIDLYDILGNNIYTKSLGFLDSGKHTTTFDMNNKISTGSYLLVISAGNELISKKITKLE
ncbi:MAG: hypothetical protein A2X61_11075 [Ignavibacteria bacterium GWB2_35_12]|nr:MAG: hypothetical protein A2X61_11075 [Ignavibacteria bacterium GWB2_35_12]OGU87652.1 MAG: hypothetical protein A2220_12660 [Ignavibacteria bacterium RIFOXYA2_FULL_35_10]OGV24777.1 MAG: hypothetical protein A2475_14300 [Ignavibacteria bacterium RIFOXYC2_FULL_35_21]